MTTEHIRIRGVSADDVLKVAGLVGELLEEIMQAIDAAVFHFELAETRARLGDFLAREAHFVFLAHRGNAGAIGFLAFTDHHAGYGEGACGSIPEFFVRSEFRSPRVGLRRMRRAKSFGSARGRTRREVTTAPLPQFARTLAFDEREGFAVTGGRNLKPAR